MTKAKEKKGEGGQSVQLTQRDLDALPHYQKHLPVLPMLGYRWKRRYLDSWFMGEYVADSHLPPNRHIVKVVWRRIELFN